MDADLPIRRRFTIVELLIILALAGLLAGITVPVLRAQTESPTLSKDRREVQAAVRRYFNDTGAYPTFAPAAADDQPPLNPWPSGGLPRADSRPAFAGIDFAGQALRKGTDQRVRFAPDSLSEKPRHANEIAADGARRWRIDSQGAVSVEMDGRSY